jgi:proteasome lid subunit RPN8/RPN11
VTKVLELAPRVAHEVFEHGLEAAPHECCGILVGPNEEQATEALRSENVHENPRTEYEIDPELLFEAVERTDGSAVEIVGFYHSHPRGYAAFSETDVGRGSWAGKTYLLASLAPLRFLGGVWNGEGFDEVPVRVDLEA